MTRTMYDAAPTGYARLLGGWRDIQDDLRRLAALVKTLPTEGCSCTSHGDGRDCPCCAAAQRALDHVCAPCEALVHGIDAQLGDLHEHMLRYLPAVRATARPEDGPLAAAQFAALQEQVSALLHLFASIRGAAGVFATGCRGAHVVALRTLVPEVLATVHDLSAALAPGASGPKGIP